MLTNEAATSLTDQGPRGWAIPLDGLGLAWRGRLWVAGALALEGEQLDLVVANGAWVFDCAGLVPERWAAQARRFLRWVFADLEQVPPKFARLLAICREWAAEMPREHPSDVVVVCQYGLNRSAFVAGLLLREAGVPPEEAVARVRAGRPGALTNQTFAELVLGSR